MRQHPGTEDEINWRDDYPERWYRERYRFASVLRTREVVGRTQEDEDRIQAHVDWLVESMGEVGQLDPIFVKKYNKGDMVHPGVSRMVAAKKLGWTWLWAIVSDRRTL